MLEYVFSCLPIADLCRVQDEYTARITSKREHCTLPHTIGNISSLHAVSNSRQPARLEPNQVLKASVDRYSTPSSEFLTHQHFWPRFLHTQCRDAVLKLLLWFGAVVLFSSKSPMKEKPQIHSRHRKQLVEMRRSSRCGADVRCCPREDVAKSRRLKCCSIERLPLGNTIITV